MNSKQAYGCLAIVVLACGVSPARRASSHPHAAPGAGPRIHEVSAPARVALFGKFEISFQLSGATAGNYQLPYDPAPPPGLDPRLPAHRGISVDAIFTPDNWRTLYRQPAFFYTDYADEGLKPSWDGHQHEWYYPSGTTCWKVRFAPHRTGTWQFKLSARDAGGSGDSEPHSFSVTDSADPGFVRVGRKDPRYFEFDNGDVFLSPGLHLPGPRYDPVKDNQPDFEQLRESRIRLVRYWIGGLYGSAWPRWLGDRNLYDGYLPRAGVLPLFDPAQNRGVMTVNLSYPEGWFDACRYEFWDDAEAVKPQTVYKLTVRYQARDITGPRVAGHSRFGLVGKISESGAATCHEPGTGVAVTDYGGNSQGWQTIEGTWFSGNRHFLPRVSVGLENVSRGEANILSISLREVFADNQYGPEILQQPSMEYELYFPELPQFKMDRLLELAERYGVYLKLVLLEKGDSIYSKLQDDGSFVLNGTPDNLTGFYGVGRTVNKTRWLQQAWWRYVQARWGYSTHVHSWELTNEGDPFLVSHWEMADEFGKFMHCRVFGVPAPATDGAVCAPDQPNRHLVTTSFWHSFPGYSPQTGAGFWGSPKYRNLDYADVHAYIATSPAPPDQKSTMENDAALYHLWHSARYASWNFRFPIVRGEAGIDSAAAPGRPNPALLDDAQGVWYHNFLWSSLDSGALYEIYWWASPHIYNGAAYDHRPAALAFYKFISGEPLNNGFYRDLAATVSDPDLRVVGQKDTRNGRAHLWVQNRRHTSQAAEQAGIRPISATVRIPGFAPHRNYALEFWDPYESGARPKQTASAPADALGRLEFSVGPIATDVAVKIKPGSSQPHVERK
jgi:hypothetical protein